MGEESRGSSAAAAWPVLQAAGRNRRGQGQKRRSQAHAQGGGIVKGGRSMEHHRQVSELLSEPATSRTAPRRRARGLARGGTHPAVLPRHIPFPWESTGRVSNLWTPFFCVFVLALSNPLTRIPVVQTACACSSLRSPWPCSCSFRRRPTLGASWQQHNGTSSISRRLRLAEAAASPLSTSCACDAEHRVHQPRRAQRPQHHRWSWRQRALVVSQPPPRRH